MGVTSATVRSKSEWTQTPLPDKKFANKPSDRVPDWITGTTGQETQERVWNDIEQELEKIEPGCIGRLKGGL